MKQWKIVSSKEETRELVLEKCIVGIISNRKQTSTILKSLQDLPSKLNHLKRVRNYQNQLEIIICEIDQKEIETKFSNWKSNEENIKMINDLNGIEIESLKLVEIPKYPPVTKEQYKVYSQYWPCNLSQPSYPTPNLTLDDIKFVSDQFNYLFDWMKKNLSVEINQNENNSIQNENGECDKRNVTIITNTEHEIVSIQQDKTEETGHPLMHSCYQCLKSIPLEKKNYLCTGFDVFLLYEPCLFCGMSLLHSRIGRVFFIHPHETNGAFTVHGLHKNAYLNHHFNVYQIDF